MVEETYRYVLKPSPLNLLKAFFDPPKSSNHAFWKMKDPRKLAKRKAADEAGQPKRLIVVKLQRRYGMPVINEVRSAERKGKGPFDKKKKRASVKKTASSELMMAGVCGQLEGVGAGESSEFHRHYFTQTGLV